MKVRHIFDRVCLQRVHFSFFENINVFESTAAIHNGKVVDTGAKELSLTHVCLDSNLFFDCTRIGFKNTHTFVYNNCHQTSYKLIISLT